MQNLLAWLVLLYVALAHASNPSSLSYIGAVVEYRPVTEGKDGLKVAEQNAVHVDTIVKKASEYNTDIIVFPEIGLTSLTQDRTWSVERIRAHYYSSASYIPAPEEKVVLCNSEGSYTKALKSVSCTAKKYKTYIVVNHHEKVDCPDMDCANDGFLIYNTNVVFDREGKLIARYRKYNLFSEPGVNITARPEVSTFDTDFGVKFGQIICNDILYVSPSLDLVKQGVTDVAFSAEWFSELPFLTSVETHSAWAYVNDVNLLSSGFNEPAITNGGSGIYLGRSGIVKATVPNDSANVLIVSEIPKIINGRRQHIANPTSTKVYTFSQAEVPTTWDDTEKFMYKDNFNLYTTEIMDPKQTSYNKELCNRGLCCNFNLKTSFDESLAKTTGTDYYRYRVGVFNGVRLFAGLFTVGIEVCGVFFCRNETLSSCGERFASDVNVVEPTNFHSVVIERTADDNNQKFYLPVTLTKDLHSIDASKISYSVSSSENKYPKTTKTLKMSLTKEESNLRAFAIYGRNLPKDGSDLTTSSS